MKFATVSDDFLKLCYFDKELLHNKGGQRPYLVVVRLNYNGHKQNFAIPFRSNISNYIPKEQYFSLPPRSTTKKNKIHGLHYIKMFPIRKFFLEKFHMDKDEYYKKIYKIINRKAKDIVDDAQAYLRNYEKGIRLNYCTNIDKIYHAINNLEALEEVAADIDILESSTLQKRCNFISKTNKKIESLGK